jgi:hypothetical protein
LNNLKLSKYLFLETTNLAIFYKIVKLTYYGLRAKKGVFDVRKPIG